MINVTTAIIQDKRVKSQGDKYAIKLRVTYNRQQKYYFLNEHFTQEEWEKINSNKARGKQKEYSDYFQKIEEHAIKIIRELHPFTFDIFESRFFQKPAEDTNLLEAMQNYADKKREKGCEGSAQSYETSLRSIQKFATNKKRKKIHFEEVTIKWLNKYEEWMLERGNSISTVGMYTRNIRTIINEAIRNKLLNQESYPFGKGKYKIPASKNKKKALHIEEIEKIINYEPFTPAEAKSRDMWLFSYLCNGINPKDICLLQYKDIDDESIQFIREKTKRTQRSNIKPIRIILIPEIKAIIKRWGQPSLDPEAYIFGYIQKDSTPRYIQSRVHDIVQRVNRHMKDIGKTLGINKPIQAYTARHSFATILKRSGAPTEYISESLGHASLSTTASYLDSFEDDTKKKYQSALLNFHKEKKAN